MNKKFQYFIKRIFDIFFSMLMLICSSPFVLIAVMMIKFSSPKDKVLFKQVRSGYKTKPFVIYKLRTMTNERDENGKLLPDERRLKIWGKIIRKTNLDEIPQVLNVFKGDMSLIGPRPFLPTDVARFDEKQLHRADILPGITGLEAINEHKVRNWDEKIGYDIFYVDNFSLWLDIKIFFRTIFVIFFARRPEHRFEGHFEPQYETQTEVPATVGSNGP